jgi:hypothetical protein
MASSTLKSPWRSWQEMGLGGYISLAYLFPDLELLAPNGRTRFRRFRGAVYLLLVGVVGSIVAAVVLGD